MSTKETEGVKTEAKVIDHCGLKKVKENALATRFGSEQIELIILKDKNQYVVEISSVSNGK